MDTTTKTTDELEAMYQESIQDFLYYCREGTEVQKSYHLGYKNGILCVMKPDIMAETRREYMAISTDAEGRARLRGFNDALKDTGYTS
jgi:hypothetical protein